MSRGEEPRGVLLRDLRSFVAGLPRLLCVTNGDHGLWPVRPPVWWASADVMYVGKRVSVTASMRLSSAHVRRVFKPRSWLDVSLMVKVVHHLDEGGMKSVDQGDGVRRNEKEPRTRSVAVFLAMR